MDYLDNANDCWLKPRLLMAIVRDRLPDDKRPLGDACRLSHVFSLVRMHSILSESHSSKVPGKDESKLAAAWSAAVDSWVDRCLSLSSSKMPDKCWAGISLLGLTCELCSSERFLASYSIWFEALLSNLQPLPESDLVKLATCASMSDIFTRLSRFPNVKKDATSLASKLVHPVIQLMSDNSMNTLMLGATDLLGALLTFFPFSLHRHYEKAEAVIISSLMANKCSMEVSKKLAHCLILLPSVRGDEDSWTTMIQRVLISINMYLNQIFQGLEEERMSSEAMRLLVPPGKDPPPPLGTQFLSTSAALKTSTEIEEVVIPRLSILMQSCCTMITDPSFQVNLPIRSLILLAERVLSVDGSLHESSPIFSSELHQEILCAELPTLHLCSLDLLMAIIRSTGSQLLPCASQMKRILTNFFRRATFPCLRIKLYSILRVLLIKMGVGMALYLGEEVIENVSGDLNCLIAKKRSGVSNLDRVTGKNKKRKQRSDNVREPQNAVDIGEELLCGIAVVPLSVGVAALETIEALVTVAGSLGADHWRQDIDKLLISVATNASSMPPVNDRKISSLDLDPSYDWADFKLAALRALLASLLSHSQIRPPYLSQGLDLFHRGSKEIGTETAAFCSRAMLALEVLIHPRSLSLMDAPATKIFDFDPLTSQKSNLLLDLAETPLADDDFALTSVDIEPYQGESTAIVDSQVLAEVNVDQEPAKTLEKPTVEEEKQVKLVSNEETTTPMSVQGDGVDLLEGTDLRYNSPSPSLDSLPDIIDADPDSD